MGSGTGHFTFTAIDSLGNVGHSIKTGEALELYNTVLPTPPGQPIHFLATSLSGGRVLLIWSNVPNAEIYRLYSEPGTNFLIAPTNLIADNVVSNGYIDLQPGCPYRYVVTASRRGSEGPIQLPELRSPTAHHHRLRQMWWCSLPSPVCKSPGNRARVKLRTIIMCIETARE